MTDPRSSRAGKPRHRRPTPVGPDGPGAMDTTSRATPAAYTPDVAVPPTPPAEEAIRTRAYELYLARGGTPGHELEDWLAAEHALRPAEDRGRPTA